jgi:hypothetical protein
MAVIRAGAGLLLAVCLAQGQFGWFHHVWKTPQEKRVEPDEGVPGVVSKTSAESFTLRAADTRVITYKIADTTLFFRGNKFMRAAQLHRGLAVAVEAAADPEGRLTATTVLFREKRPLLKESASAGALLPGGVPDDPVIAQARAASEYLERMLPNFVCQQSTARLWAGADQEWRNIDRVTAEVLLERGHESYRAIKLNGRPMGKSIMELPGANSTGEFGTTLRALLDRQTAALFKFQASASLDGNSIVVYEYAVSGDRTNWTISAGSQAIEAAYTGRIWIDRRTGNVVRIEKKAADIPAAFPFRKVEAKVEYGPVALPGGRYFLPVRATNLVCEDVPKECSRNEIDFRDYHRYVGETSISFDAAPTR